MKSGDSGGGARPDFTAGQAVAIARETYGLAAQARPLPGERDKNFRLTPARGQEYVLKISAAGERRDVLEFQNRALEHLAARRPGVAWPRVRRTRSGDEIATVVAGGEAGGESFLVRLLTWVPGVRLVDVRPQDAALLGSLGRFIGDLDRALEDFDHPALKRSLEWHPLNAASITRRNLPHVADDAGRACVRRYLERYEQHAAPALDRLPQGAIHNDANDYNVLVGRAEPGNPDAWQNVVTGIIDLGDMVLAPIVADLAVAAAYAMLDKPRPLRAAAQVVRGYHEARALSEAELNVLFDLICIRLCTSVTICAARQRAEPDNAYLRVSERPAWTVLHALADVHPRLAEAVFRNGCGLEASPRSAAVVGWLSERVGSFAPLVDADLRQDPLTVFDLSVDSPELAAGPPDAGVDTLSEILFGRMRREARRVGVGRYDEPRGLYTSDLFRSGSGEHVEWRTIHLGIDLFMDAGAAVYAPLAGIVHGFADNGMGLDYGPTILLEHRTAAGVPFFTLYGHLSRESLHGLRQGLPIEQGRRIGSIGAAAVNGGWPPHLHFQLLVDDLGRTSEFPGVASAEERAVWRSLCPDPNVILGIPATAWPPPELTPDEIRTLRARHLGKSLSLAYDRPLKIVRGRGQFLYDDTGRRYLDCVNNVAHVGHAHPRVVAAARDQDSVLNTNTRYLHDNLARYVERLQATLPDPLSVVYLVCSGSEANDLALRLARTHTGRRDVIVVDGGYHGNLGTLIEISPYKFNGPGGDGAPAHVHPVAMPDRYRGAFRGNDAGTLYAALVREAVARAASRGGVAAFICESLLGCGGQIVLPENYLAEAFGHVRAAGGVCIADEVQVGFGRVGSHFWGFETQRVIPDIVTLGKPIGNGHPLAAVVTTPEIAGSFAGGMEYFNTFGGNTVSCAVGLAVLDVIERERLQAHALDVGAYLLGRLRVLAREHPIVGDVRGLGLFLGIELVRDPERLTPAPAQAAYIVNRMQHHGILLSTDGPLHNVIKIKPPLVFDRDDADLLVNTLGTVLVEDFVLGDLRPREPAS